MLNEAELLLLKEWHAARQLEKTLEEVRKKYSALQEDVASAVTEAFPELTISKVRTTQFWSSGFIAFSKSAWIDGGSDDPPGLWMDQLRIERLSDPAHPAPTASVWIPRKIVKKLNPTLSELRHTLQDAAKEMFSAEEHAKSIRPDSENEAVVYFNTPGKNELINLFAAGDAAAFIQAVSGTFETMARMLPVLDKILT